MEQKTFETDPCNQDTALAERQQLIDQFPPLSEQEMELRKMLDIGDPNFSPVTSDELKLCDAINGGTLSKGMAVEKYNMTMHSFFACEVINAVENQGAPYLKLDMRSFGHVVTGYYAVAENIAQVSTQPAEKLEPHYLSFVPCNIDTGQTYVINPGEGDPLSRIIVQTACPSSWKITLPSVILNANGATEIRGIVRSAGVTFHVLADFTSDTDINQNFVDFKQLNGTNLQTPVGMLSIVGSAWYPRLESTTIDKIILGNSTIFAPRDFIDSSISCMVDVDHQVTPTSTIVPTQPPITATTTPYITTHSSDASSTRPMLSFPVPNLRAHIPSSWEKTLASPEVQAVKNGVISALATEAVLHATDTVADLAKDKGYIADNTAKAIKVGPRAIASLANPLMLAKAIEQTVDVVGQAYLPRPVANSVSATVAAATSVATSCFLSTIPGTQALAMAANAATRIACQTGIAKPVLQKGLQTLKGWSGLASSYLGCDQSSPTISGTK